MRRLTAALLLAFLPMTPAAAVTVIGTPAQPAVQAPPQDARTDSRQLHGNGRIREMVSGLPESHTWAALLLGFGLVGFASRWRRKSLPRLAD